MSASCQIHVGVVDDDESACRALSRLLRAEGLQPVCYLSAEAFLADTKRPAFDCLVFDVQLGGMSGVELHRQLVASGSSTPVIYITAHDEAEARKEAEAAGYAPYFRKTAPGRVVLQADTATPSCRSPSWPTAAHRWCRPEREGRNVGELVIGIDRAKLTVDASRLHPIDDSVAGDAPATTSSASSPSSTWSRNRR